jgi:hypothetical protein
MLLQRRIPIVFFAGIVLPAMIIIASLSARLVVSKHVTASKHAAREGSVEEAPHLVLWAWERPTDLNFINPQEVAVAFLARTINLRDNSVTVRPRLQPLDLPEATSVIAVARVESDRAQKSALSAQQRDALVTDIVEMAAWPRVASIQIDFDATRSEREFYREVITEVRKRLPRQVGLSITALASWCMDDDWISDLPIDEAVPMLFRMAADGKQIVTRLNGGDDFNSPKCRHSYGFSTDEPHPQLTSTPRRLYVFSPERWTESSVRKILESSR